MTHGNAGSGPTPLPDPDTTGITAGFYLEKLLPLYHQFRSLMIYSIDNLFRNKPFPNVKSRSCWTSSNPWGALIVKHNARID